MSLFKFRTRHPVDAKLEAGIYLWEHWCHYFEQVYFYELLDKYGSIYYERRNYPIEHFSHIKRHAMCSVLERQEFHDGNGAVANLNARIAMNLPITFCTSTGKRVILKLDDD